MVWFVIISLLYVYVDRSNLPLIQHEIFMAFVFSTENIWLDEQFTRFYSSFYAKLFTELFTRLKYLYFSPEQVSSNRVYFTGHRNVLVYKP